MKVVEAGVVVLAFLGAITPGVVLLAAVYASAPSPRRRLAQVGTAFGVGLITVVPASVLETPGLVILSVGGGSLLFAVVWLALIAGTVEEGVKLGFLRMLTYRRGDITRAYDGVMFGASVSLGFATAENALYVYAGYLSGHLLAIVVLRALLAVPAHGLVGVLLGYFVGRGRAVASQSTGLLWAGYLVAATMHALYDFLALATVRVAQDLAAQVVFGLLLLGMMAALWGMAITVIALARREPPLPPPASALPPSPTRAMPAEVAPRQPLPGHYCVQCGSPARSGDILCVRCGTEWSRPRA